MFPIKGNTRPVSAGGFTLLELMVSVSLSFILMAGTLAVYTYVGRNFTRMSNSQRLDALSRRAFAVFTKDVRYAAQIDTANSTATKLVLSLPILNPSPSDPKYKTVTYAYKLGSGTDYNRGYLERKASPVRDPEDYNTVILTGIDTTVATPLQFNYLDTSGNKAPIANAKTVEFAFVTASTSDKQGSTYNLKKSNYATVSSRVALANRSFLQ